MTDKYVPLKNEDDSIQESPKNATNIQQQVQQEHIETQPQIFLAPLHNDEHSFYQVQQPQEPVDKSLQNPAFILFVLGFFLPCIWIYNIVKYRNSGDLIEKRWAYWSMIALLCVTMFYAVLILVVVLV
ncbi:hypothetical protein ENUP19_0126G0046 [Entamoeba nuttalli]|uniref:Transmembrane protein n=2 Tax=Entamoeba nuttalli TaxID=412467 RepID=K2H7E8_ENTNP|nr:hypothetical protein ENU1_018840 [Entamoeba nuttalli P19]EKE42507.1 hypothetical protein ENU1_018840 [Entamoeba nuttalli P19]|eukprot:XP_008855158.1 hypothetical protein ENU1_018840 [Entamoeba nuttalli P19]